MDGSQQKILTVYDHRVQKGGEANLKRDGIKHEERF